MANKSRWKNWERQVATVLGGKRRHRTTESFGKMATDVYFPKDMRRRYPLLKKVKVECKKRKSLNVHASFAETKLKYAPVGDEIVIFASKIPLTKKGRARFVKLKKKLARKHGFAKKKDLKKIKLRDFASGLVTVELSFFEDLWNAWLLVHRRKSDG